MNCVEYVNYELARRYPLQANYKTCAELYDDMVNSPWVLRSQFQHIQVGDVLCWRKTIYSAQEITGHACFVVNPPVWLAPNVLRITVLDCTRRAHGMDSRHNGIGTGEMWFSVDGTWLTGYQWWRFGRLNFRPIRVGAINVAI